jgi:hypothetical protein
VNQETLEMLCAAEEAVQHIIELCRKDSILYARDARAVAHVSRTGKWHLNAIASLRKVLEVPADDGPVNEVGKRGS